MDKILGLPELASKHGVDVDRFIVYIHYLMIALFIGWSAYFLYALWRFRSSRHPKADYVGVTSHASSYLELAVAAVEILLLVGFAIPMWAKVVDQGELDVSKAQLIRVTAQQFAWSGRYPGPDGKFGKQDMKLAAPSNKLGLWQMDEKLKEKDPDGKDDVVLADSVEIVAPVDTDVIVSLSSLDVIHSFKVPAMRMTHDAIPGMRIPVHFHPTKTGTFQINCAQLCGVGHSRMKSTFKVVSTNEFEVWLKSKAGSAPVSFE